MRILHSISHRFLLISLLSLALVLVACGSNAGPGSNPPASPTTVVGYGTAYGCPSDAVVTTAPSTPNVTIHSNQANTTITAHTGDIVEIQLPFGHKWNDRITPQTQSILQLQTPAGYAWKADNVCIWRFVAKIAGKTDLVFEARALCKQGQLCPQYVMDVPFTIDVK